MKKEYATLRRKPFLTPIWLAALAALVVVSFTVWLWGTATSTTVVLVRHAEKQLNAGDDPVLTPAGEARAALLARMFGDRVALGGLDAIYVSPTRRSHQTAAPLAARLKLQVTEGPEDDVKLLSRQVLRDHQGGRVLIVGHSNTIPGLVERLSGEGKVPEIGDDEYGTMYIVTVPRIGHANVLRLTY
jgi:2,3-bisphosphoglycerate-dependent phosphoglycerate mutase